ncbi:MAG: DUF6160 family protein [Alcanivoracaceae bacterium]|jgi:hypothetical protein|nr:DUF6160 family protein [Alcanivoracaceae bacterium]
MKGFKKLALVTAVAALPMSGFAMEALDDATLSGVTGQDGLTVTIDVPNLSLDVVVHDNDGLVLAPLAGDAGAIVITGVNVQTGAGGIVMDIDADGNAGAPVLNVGVSIGAGTIIDTGAISVAESNGIGNALGAQSATILTSMQITLGAVDLNIQLGDAEPQGSMIAMNTVITGGVSIAGFALADASSGSTISVGQIDVADSAGADLTVGDVTVDVENAGLVIGLNSVGDVGGLSLQMTGVTLGGANAIGDIEVIGLQLSGTTITVAGH